MKGARLMCAGSTRADLCNLYEKELKTLNPGVRNITYDIADLNTYIEQLTDLNCLVYAIATARTPVPVAN